MREIIPFGEIGFFFILLRSWAKNFRPFSRSFRRGYQNCILCFHRNNVMEKIRFFFSINFRHWEKNFLPFLGKIWRESQNCVLKVHTNFFEESILSWNNRFPDFFQTWVETFWFLLKFSGVVFKVAFYKSIRTFQLKKFHLKKIFSLMLFRLDSFYFWKLVEMFPARLLKLQSTRKFEESE